jgi:hypothetical protein
VLPQRAQVRRDGRRQEIEAEALVGCLVGVGRET